MRTKTALICGVALVFLATGYGYRDRLEAALWPASDKAAADGSRAAAGRDDTRQGRRRGPREVPVLVGKVEARTTPRKLAVIGAAQAYATVAVKSRVDGQIVESFFRDGQTVRQGDLLFRIDPRPLEVALRQTQANLERDRAQAKKAEGDVARYQSLVGKGFASQQKYEEARATFEALQGTMRAGEAAIEAARLQLEYTTIRSPIDGRTGSLLVDTGNLVKGNDSQALVVITQLRPIYVTFSVPERYLARVKELMAAGEIAVEAKIPGAKAPPLRGRLAFINNAVDTTTGTIQLKAVFENEQTELTAGQFVNVAMTLEERPGALVVPSQAIQDGQRGSFVFVVKDGNTVDMRPVVVDDAVGDVTVITSGLAAGETVVLDGQLLLRPGAKVAPRAADGAPARAQPGGGGDRKGRKGGKRRPGGEGA
jgi:multidrug efflux system membrane fusion protein